MNFKKTLAVVGLTAFLASAVHAQTYNFSTLAGGLTQGSVDAKGKAARFYYPWNTVADGAGNVFVADTYNRTIRKISPSGNVTTVAGLAGSQGDSNGTGTSARFFFPAGLALNEQGMLYIADHGAIRKMTPDGVVTTFAGMPGVGGNVDGTGTEARFYGSQGLAFDRVGNLYLADTSNRTIRKITTNAVVTTIAGPTGFIDPRGVAIDSAGNIYVAEGAGSRIQKVTPEGVVSTLAGKIYTVGTQDGLGGAARFGNPQGLAIDSTGNLYVADTAANTIRKITPEGLVSTIAGVADGTYGYVDGIGSVARFNALTGVAVDKWGNLLIADTNNNMIRKGTPILPLQISSSGSQLTVSWPSWAANYLLENRPAIGDTNAWTAITNGITGDTNNFIYAFPPTNSAQFFRVRSP